MNIIITSHLFLPEHTSGTELIAYHIAKELQSRGHQVTVIAARPLEPAPNPLPAERFESYTYDGLPVHRFLHAYDMHEGQTNPFQAEYNHRVFYRWFKEFLIRHRPDVVHFVHLSRLSASAVDACTELGIKTVFTSTDFWSICPTSQLRLPDNSMCPGPTRDATNCIRHIVETSQPAHVARKVRRVPDFFLRLIIRLIRRGWFKRKWYAAYLRALADRPGFILERIRKLDIVLVPSHTMEKLLIRNGFPAEKVRYLPYGIHIHNIERHAHGKGSSPTLRLAFIGQIYEHKGCHLIIEALRLLPKDAPIRVRFHGDLTQDAAYAARLKELSTGDSRVEFPGRFLNTKVSEVLADTDVLVCPSLWYENTPLVIYEAMAAGVPVIASDLPGMAEAIKPEINGLLFEKNNAVSLAEALGRLLGNRELLPLLAARTEPPLTVRAHVTELEELYTRLIQVT